MPRRKRKWNTSEKMCYICDGEGKTNEVRYDKDGKPVKTSKIITCKTCHGKGFTKK